MSYTSQLLTKTEFNYSNIECECLAVVFGLEHFTPFCYGPQIIFKSDHKPLESIFSKPISLAPSHLQRMLLQISIYDVNIIYIKELRDTGYWLPQ